MPPKTILLIIDGLAGGGAEKVVLTLAEAMAARGHAVTLLLLRAACAYALPLGVRVETLVDDYTGPLRDASATEVIRRLQARLQAHRLPRRGCTKVRPERARPRRRLRSVPGRLRPGPCSAGRSR